MIHNMAGEIDIENTTNTYLTELQATTTNTNSFKTLEFTFWNRTKTNFLNGSSNGSNHEISLSDESLAGLIVLYTLTTLFSVTGNIFAVLVFTKGRHSRTDLRHFLVNLAVADLVMAMFCMPFTFADVILNEWIFSKPMCPIVLFVQLLAVTASVLTNMAIGIDRFLAVTFPLHLRVTFSRKKYVISVIWICAFSLASVQFFEGRAVDVGGGNLKCIETWESAESRRIYTIFILLFTYIIPLLILAITYTIVGIILWKRTAPGNEDYARDRQRLKSKIKIVKMLVIVVAVFGLCWLPIHVFTMILDFKPEILHYETMEDAMTLMTIYLCVHWLAMSNSFANPLIYGFTNANFRADLATLMFLWFPCCGCLRRVIPKRQYSSSTRDSVIMRRQSTFKSSRVGNGFHSVKNDVSLVTTPGSSKHTALRQISKDSTLSDCSAW
ncbi:neuropeptide Y receptor type 5-like [Mytilus californianus]|uniref:neuropeptide Y receptor type 5-like n=1 Tax=Mytilus californianus TaxID=6549 RepID=UPI0022463B26|nr:neuropeptide Y receptor type 5-like [Mytilus californianus]